MLSLEPELVLKENDGTKLTGIVLYVEAILLALDDGMAPAHTDVIDPHLRLVAPTKLELGLLVGYGQQVDVSRGIFIQRHGLQQNVVVVRLGGDFIG